MERVRQVLIMQPNMGVIKISKVLNSGPQEQKIKLHPHYISKLKKKIIGERTWRYEKAKVKRRIAEIEDQTRMLQATLWNTVNNPLADPNERTNAAKTIAALEHKLFQSQMDSGIYERKLGTIEVEEMRSRAINPEAEQAIIEAFKVWGVVEKPPEAKKIEAAKKVIDLPVKKEDDKPKEKTTDNAPAASKPDPAGNDKLQAEAKADG